MINLRYHIVSLVAVFLALALGIVVGTTVIDQGLVDALKGQRQTLRDRQVELRDENDALKRELALWERYGDTLVPPLMRDRLRGRRVVLLLDAGVPGELIGRVEDAIVQAGGARAGRVVFTDKLRLLDEPTREQLALALEAGPGEDRAALLQRAAARAAARLPTPADVDASNDLLAPLVRAGFVRLDDVVDRDRFPPRGALFVYLSSGASTVLPSRDLFAAPLVRALAAPAAPLVVAEPLGAEESIVDVVRGDGDLRGRVAGVDHVDTTLGRLALVVALQDLAAERPPPQYGIRRGANAVAPAVA